MTGTPPPHELLRSVLPNSEDYETAGRLALARLDEDWQRVKAIIGEIVDGRDKTAVMRLVIAATSVLLGRSPPPVTRWRCPTTPTRTTGKPRRSSTPPAQH